MQEDLRRAGIPYQDEDGLFADFHANRHTFITNLGRAGIPLATAQKLARHSDPKLTSNVYTHLELSDKAKAIGSLPDPPKPHPQGSEGSALRATGTDDERPGNTPETKSLRTACAQHAPKGHGKARRDTPRKKKTRRNRLRKSLVLLDLSRAVTAGHKYPRQGSNL